jgi:hypothetical protein
MRETVEASADAAYDGGVVGKSKPAAQRMSRIIQLRLTPAQYRAFAKAAADAGLPLTTWLRALGVKETRSLRRERRGLG